MTSASPSAVSLIRSRVRGVFERRATWVLIDQAVVSLGNFLTGNLLTRYLDKSENGIYGLLLETMLYLNSLQAAIIIYPLTIRGATGDGKNLGRLATASVIFTFVLLPLLGGATFYSLYAIKSQEPTVVIEGLGIVTVAALLLWQVQETLRRGLIADLRMRDSVWSDAVRYIGQAGLMLVLALSGKLSLWSAMLVMAATSAASIAIQAMQIGLARVNWSELRAMAVDFWRLGQWMILSNALALVTTIGYWWTLMWTHGAEACGVFTALMLLFKLANPVMNGMSGLITPAVARAAAGSDHHEVRRIAMRYITFGAALLMPYFLILALAPRFSLRLFYSADSPYIVHVTELRLFVANFVCVYFSSVIIAWLAGLGHSRWNFYVQLWCIAATLVIGLPLTVKWGLYGVTIGGLTTSLVAVLAAAWYIRRADHEAAKG